MLICFSGVVASRAGRREIASPPVFTYTAVVLRGWWAGNSPRLSWPGAVLFLSRETIGYFRSLSIKAVTRLSRVDGILALLILLISSRRI